MRLNDFKRKAMENDYRVEMGFIETKLFAEETNAMVIGEIENRGIKVFYLVRKSTKRDAPYVIFFNGGPGIGFSEQFFEHDRFSDFLPEYNIVFMDQRGTGFSDKPSQGLDELAYFSSKYICADADLLRRELLGEDGKWIVFGQSFGGHLVRKYLERYAQHTLVGVSHGYGEGSVITMKTHIEKQLFDKVRAYFAVYPDDKSVFEQIRDALTDDDTIETEDRVVRGRYILDIFAFYFGLYSFEKIHDIVQGFGSDNAKQCFIDEVTYIGGLILGAGLLNMAVAFIDLVDGQTDEVIYNKAQQRLKDEGISTEDEMFCTLRLAQNLTNCSKDIARLEGMFERGEFVTDPLDMYALCVRLQEYGTELFVIGSRNDTITPVEVIEEEQRAVDSIENNTKYRFVY